MTRDELEAEIRTWITRVAIATLDGDIPTDVMNRATVAILHKADAYGLSEFGISAERRRLALAEAVGDGSYGGIAGGS